MSKSKGMAAEVESCWDEALREVACMVRGRRVLTGNDRSEGLRGLYGGGGDISFRTGQSPMTATLAYEHRLK